MAATAFVEPGHEPSRTGSPLLDRLWHAARSRGDCAPNADVLAAWARRFILFHDRRHPRELGLAHVTHFLEHVARTEREPLPALAQARAALALLYQGVVGTDLGNSPGRDHRACSINCACYCLCGIIPVPPRIATCSGRGASFCFITCATRERWQRRRSKIRVQAGKGNKDRVVMLPRSVQPDLERQPAARRSVHEHDLRRGVARADLRSAPVFPGRKSLFWHPIRQKVSFQIR